MTEPAPPTPPDKPSTRRAKLAQGIKSGAGATASGGMSWFKRFAAKLWASHGGGLYGFGYMLTFIWLELRTLTSEFGEADGVVDFVAGQFLERFFKVAIESFMNSIKALMWPVIVITEYQLAGIVAIVVVAAAYKRFVHHRIAAMLGVDPEEIRESKAKD